MSKETHNDLEISVVSSSSSGKSETEGPDASCKDFKISRQLLESHYKKEDQHEDSETKPHSTSEDKIKNDTTPTDSNSHTKEKVKPTKLDFESNREIDSTQKHSEFTVLRRHLEKGEASVKFAITRDPRRHGKLINKIQPCTKESGTSSRHNYIESKVFESPYCQLSSDYGLQSPSGDFNKVIYVMYRELLSPLSQHLIAQLSEILFLVVSESVRYSDRCRKAKRLVSPELIVREEIMAHRDFQANTIFYGMYFTHLFRNIEQCFPVAKAFHTFMYLALFVQLFRRLKSVYNVHSTYLHIVRKLVVSMLKANGYEDILMFSAICKPDAIFETDFVLVSQLIDSFEEYAKSSNETDCFAYDTAYLLQDPVLDRNSDVCIIGSSKSVHPPQYVPTSSQLNSVPPQSRPFSREEESMLPPKRPKLASSIDQRTFSYFSDVEMKNRETIRPPFYYVTGVSDPPSVPQSTPRAGPSTVDRCAKQSCSEKVHTKVPHLPTFSGREDPHRSLEGQVWRPTAVRPRASHVAPCYPLMYGFGPPPSSLGFGEDFLMRRLTPETPAHSTVKKPVPILPKLSQASTSQVNGYLT